MQTNSEPTVMTAEETGSRAEKPKAVVCKKLLAFSVTTEYAEVHILLFAPNRNRAKAIAHGSEWLCNEKWTDLRVKREPKADYAAAKFGEGYLQCDTADEQRIHRELGWYQVDHSMTECCKCGLHEWSSVPESQTREIGDIGEVICVGCQKKANDQAQRQRQSPEP